MLVGLTAGRQAFIQNTGRFENLNSLWIASVGFSQRLTKVQYYCSVTNTFQSVFWVKYIVRRVIEVRKSGMPCFLCLSLLLTIKYYRT